MSKITRRKLLKYSAYGAGSLVVSTGIIACGDNDNNVSQAVPMSFTHGVASGDPQDDRVILWVRAVPDDQNANPDLLVTYEVATDVAFTQLSNSGESTVNADTDFILKVDAQNLQPETTYYYRFTSNGNTSVIGKTKTLPLPTANITQVKFAVFSCANYPIGYFNAYNEAAKMMDIDAVVHLGDYIYEYKTGEYGSRPQDNAIRNFPEDNDVEIVTLEDYRKRYALYRSDMGLQTLHANNPFIVVPDDHEVANDTYIDGAENHNDSEGDFNERKLNALKAYFEWLPIRPVTENDEETLYRSFTWGNLVDLIMLDTRLIGRDEQLPGLTDPSWYTGMNNSFNAAAFTAALFDTTRTMLGLDQLTWLQGELQSSSSQWQVLGQQVLMGRMNLPFDVIAQVPNAVEELVTIKGRILQGDPSVTDEERARLDSVVPYNLDAWDGYGYEREVIFNTAQSMNNNLVVLAGDTHNAWANNLRTLTDDAVGVEFATASVSSPGLEDFLELDTVAAQQFEGGLSFLIDELQYANFYDRGLMLVTFTPEEAQAEWLYVDTIKDESYSLIDARTSTRKVLAGENILQPS